MGTSKIPVAYGWMPSLCKLLYEALGGALIHIQENIM